MRKSSREKVKSRKCQNLTETQFFTTVNPKGQSRWKVHILSQSEGQLSWRVEITGQSYIKSGINKIIFKRLLKNFITAFEHLTSFDG